MELPMLKLERLLTIKVAPLISNGTEKNLLRIGLLTSSLHKLRIVEIPLTEVVTEKAALDATIDKPLTEQVDLGVTIEDLVMMMYIMQKLVYSFQH